MDRPQCFVRKKSDRHFSFASLFNMSPKTIRFLTEKRLWRFFRRGNLSEMKNCFRAIMASGGTVSGSIFGNKFALPEG